MYLALMLKLCRAEKPDTEGPGQQTSRLEAFSCTPAFKVALHPGRAGLDVVQQGRAPVRRPSVLLWTLLLDIWRLVVRRTRLYVLLSVSQAAGTSLAHPAFHLPQCCLTKCLHLPNLLALTHELCTQHLQVQAWGDSQPGALFQVHLQHSLLSTSFME